VVRWPGRPSKPMPKALGSRLRPLQHVGATHEYHDDGLGKRSRIASFSFANRSRDWLPGWVIRITSSGQAAF